MIYNLGRVVPLFKGNYDAATTYGFLDVVFYDNSSFVALDTTTGNLPTDTSHWLPVALKGLTQNPTPAQMQQIISEVETYMHGTDFVYDPDYTHIDVIDNHTSTSTTNALSANQGKVLYETIDGVSHTVSDINNNINSFSYYTYYTDLEYSTWGEGHYINSIGNISIHGNYYIRYFTVQAGHTYRIHRNSIYGTAAAALIYAVYNTSTKEDWSSSTCVQYLPYTISSGELDIEITINTGGVVLALTCKDAYKAILQDITKEQMSYQEIKPQLDSISTPIDEVIEDSSLPITSGGVYDAIEFSYKPYYTDMEYSTWSASPGPYINSNGNINYHGSYSIRYFNVEAGQTYRIHRNILYPQSAAACIYAVYNTSDYTQWSSTTAVQKTSTTISGGDLDIEITINTGGVVLALTVLSTYQPILQSIGKEQMSYPDIDNRIETNATDIQSLDNRVDAVESVIDTIKTNFIAELDADGTNFYAAYLDLNTQTEYTYWFKKCMANELFTFYRVGFRSVSDRTFADTTGISLGTDITYINSTGSDNIGPIGFDIVGDNPNLSTTGANGLVGGNHVWNNDNTLRVKTALNHSYDCYVDGKKLANGDKMFGKNAIIKVVNYIYDPAETPSTGQTILTRLISTETVYYSIVKNNIEVSLQHKIASNATNILNRYYGMQSMFNNETEILTPKGYYDEWFTLDSASISFTKENYPTFNRFIEKNSTSGTNNYYQSAYLIPNKNGSHDLINNSGVIFSHNGGKSYHHIFGNTAFDEPTPNLSIVWSGVYTFFSTAIQDDTNVLVYRGTINGKDAIFVNTFGSFTDIEIPMPEDLIMRKMNEIERDTVINTTNTFIDTTGIQLTSTGKGSFIFTLD